MARPKKTYVWKDPRPAGWFTIAAMSLNILYLTASFAFNLIVGVEGYYRRDEQNLTELQAARAMLDVGSLLVLLLCAGSAFWVVRVSKNAHSADPGMKISPFGAVGWYVVPVAFLFKPYQAMEEIWRVSTGASFRRERLLNWWWGAFLTSNFLSTIGARFDVAGPSVVFQMGHELTGIVTSVLLTVMVLRLNALQISMSRMWDVFDDQPASPTGVLEGLNA